MIFLACSVACLFIGGTVKLIIIAAAVLTLIFTIILAALKYHSHDKKYRFLLLILILVSVILSFSRFYVHFDYKLEQRQRTYNNEYTVDAFVVSVQYQESSISRYVISVDGLDGKTDKHKAILDCNFQGALAPGDKISFNATATALDTSGVKYSERIELYSNNIFVVYTADGEDSLTVHEYNSDANGEPIFDRINRKMSDILRKSVGGEEGNLCSALLLGNKHLLSLSVRRDFNRAGASHILALSGMHMSIIMGAAMFIIKRLTRKKFIIASVLSFFAITYLAVTGFSLSATRSVIMLLIVYLSILISALPDSLTSLSIAGFLIILFSPGAVLDASFWMSFAATLGILVFIPPLNDYFREKASKYDNPLKFKVHKLLYSLITAIATGAAAIISLIAVLCIFVKEISLFSIASSIILSIPTAITIILSLILLPLHSVPFISQALALTLKLMAKFMIGYCAEISKLDGTVYSLNYPFAIAMAIIVGLSLIYCFASKHKKPFSSIIPFAVCIVLCIGTMITYEKINADTLKVSYINASSTSDILVLSNQNEVVICDISNGSMSSYYMALDEVYEARATEIKAIMLTRYTNQHIPTLANVCSSIRVRELWVPTPQNEDEYYWLSRIYEFSKDLGVDVLLYDQGETLYAFGNIAIEHTSDKIDRSAVPLSLIGIYTIREHMTYVSPSFNESNISELAEHHFSKSKYIVFGNKGPKTKTEYTVQNIEKCKIIAFADKTRAQYFVSPEYSFAAYYMVPTRGEMEFYIDK